MTDSLPVNIILENGKSFEGRGWGDFTLAHSGEFVFNTAMTGIEESMTDPSFAEQIIVNTVAHVGNTGVNFEDMECSKIWASGLICRNLETSPSNWRSKASLAQWIQSHGKFVVDGINTRLLTLMLRDEGSLRGIVVKKDSMSVEEGLSFIQEKVPPMQSRELISTVSTKELYVYERSEPSEYWPLAEALSDRALCLTKSARIGVWDFGVKTNMLRILDEMGFVLTVLPSNATAEQVLKHSPDGLLLSNGPGDPEAANSIVEQLQLLIGKTPIMGICMGHQLLCRALGAKTFKMKFGHRGIHHPVVELDAKGEVLRTWITSQNHGFAVEESSLPKGVRVCFRHADDQSVEGIESSERKMFSVQFHPEVGPGPFDALELFRRFKDLVEC
ncbi:glutamine-hydrolyzing carbamoyl-phosphate synthase small subunit [bacterium]|nr:glutamine-hydrolyzing carbamoyl-phosphate synthase small subunit [bacterium]